MCFLQKFILRLSVYKAYYRVDPETFQNGKFFLPVGLSSTGCAPRVQTSLWYNHSMIKVLIIGASGAAGAVSRYLVGGWAQSLWGIQFPIGTLLVNVLGCTAIGFVGTLLETKHMFPEFRLAVMIGFLGAFTTFSSFSFETWMLVRDKNYLFAAGNIFGSLALCFLGLILGVILARFI
ncbi:MAG: CrcB protein [Candidatus Marinamargulisbacteria bacterium]|jgi:CrcB protein